MNNIIRKFLLSGDKFMSEMHLKQPRFTFSACGSYHKKTKQEYKNSEEQETPGIPTRTNYTRSVFSMIWHMEISKVYPEEQLLTKYYVIRHSKLPVI